RLWKKPALDCCIVPQFQKNCNRHLVPVAICNHCASPPSVMGVGLTEWSGAGVLVWSGSLVSSITPSSGSGSMDSGISVSPGVVVTTGGVVSVLLSLQAQKTPRERAQMRRHASTVFIFAPPK